MLVILDRFLIRDVLKTFLAVASVLLVILASNQLIRYLAVASVGNLSGDVLFRLLAVKLLGHLGLMLAPAFFIAVLLALGRMYRDNEIVALCACGIGRSRLYRAILFLVLPMTTLVGFLSFYVMPWSAEQAEVIQRQEEQSREIRGISEGRFNEIRDGKYIFYIQDLDEDALALRRVFVQGGDPGGSQSVITAQAGYKYRDPDSGELFLILEDGIRYEGQPGAADYRIAEFHRYGIRIEQPQVEETVDGRKTMSSLALLRSPDISHQAEFEWRLSVPVSMLVLTLMAVPLSRSSPREGRYGRLTLAILVYVTYSNLLAVAKSWMVRGAMPEWAGLWWVHGLMLAATLAMLVTGFGVRWTWLVLTRRAPR